MVDDGKQDVLKVGKLVIYKNALIYENSVIQISNICSTWVADHSYVIQHKVPTWIKVVGGIGALCVVSGIGGKETILVLVGLALIVSAIISFIKHKPTTPVSKYALGVERSSGRIMLFTDPDKKFVKMMASALMEAMSEKKITSEMTVMNFDNKAINIEKAVGSNIVGGDVVDSLVESLK